MKDKNVTITLSEYKELLLKERPDNNDKWLLEKIKEFMAQEFELDRNCGDIVSKEDWQFGKRLKNFIKTIDIEFYKAIVKKCYDEELEKEEAKLRVEKMNAIKELNKEEKEKENE